MTAVLRLIHPSHYNAALPSPILPLAFRPTERDVEGLSVFRADLATPEQALLAVPEAKRGLYLVARIPMEVLDRLRLAVRDDPIDEAPGHAVIPEMSRAAHEADRSKGKERQKALAEAASVGIVHRPAAP